MELACIDISFSAAPQDESHRLDGFHIQPSIAQCCSGVLPQIEMPLLRILQQQHVLGTLNVNRQRFFSCKYNSF
jgi:hypothetical protein